MKVFIVGIVFAALLYLACSEINFDVYAKSFKYSYHKDFARDVKCGFKTSRKYPGGLGNCQGFLKIPMDRAYVELQLFYKYGQIFRNYLINYKKIEPCEMLKKNRSVKYSNPLADLVLAGWKQCCPLIYHECPFAAGWYGTVNQDINGSIVPFLPPVVPAGQYKFYVRVFIDDNMTIAEIEGKGIVKPKFALRDRDYSMLNMG